MTIERCGQRDRGRFNTLTKIKADLGESNFSWTGSEVHILQTTLCLHCPLLKSLTSMFV